MHGAIRPDQLHVTSARIGSIPGTHEVLFDSPHDAIELTHRMKNRAALASGAVIAAEWLGTKKGIFTFDDVIASLGSHA